MSWRMARRGVRISPTLWMRMGLSHKVGRSRSIREDQRMTIREETSGAGAARGICPIPLSILILKLSIMVRRLKEQTLHSFKLAVAEEGPARSMPKRISKRKIEWTR